MDQLWAKIADWLKDILIDGIMSNLSGMFDSTNQKIGEIAGNVGTTPQAWNGGVFSMIQNLSETVIVPIAGLILAFVMTLELIQLITEKNNLHDLDTWMFFKWAFKSAAAVLIVTNTWNIVMGVFDVAQSVVNRASGVIVGNTSIDISSVTNGLEARLHPKIFVCSSSIGVRTEQTGRVILVASSLPPSPVSRTTHSQPVFLKSKNAKAVYISKTDGFNAVRFILFSAVQNSSAVCNISVSEKKTPLNVKRSLKSTTCGDM